MKKETPAVDVKLSFESLSAKIREAVIMNNLASLNPGERIELYECVCNQKGLDPSSRPFEFISLNGKLAMYARKEAADQLRMKYSISAVIVKAEQANGVYIVHIRATATNGRTEDDIGVTSISEPEFLSNKDGTKYKNTRHGQEMEGLDKANAMMKAVTKGKRRVTLSISGLGMFDESEIESIAESAKAKAPTLDEVRAIAAKVMALREQAAKGPKKDKAGLLAEAIALEDTIMDLPGSAHVPDPDKEPAQKPPAQSVAAPLPPPQDPPAPREPVAAPKPVVQAPAPEPVKPENKPPPEPAKPAPVAQPAPQADSAGETLEGALSETDTSGWKTHTITGIPAAEFKNVTVGSIHTDRLRIIFVNWAQKFWPSIRQNPDRRTDAIMIAAGIAERDAKK